MVLGALVPDATALAETAEALDIAHRYSEDLAVGLAQLARGMTLIYADDESRRSEGFDLLSSARDLAVRDRFAKTELAIMDVEMAAENARKSHVGSVIRTAEQVLGDLDRSGAPLYRGVATTVLVMSLLQRQAEGDLTRAHAAVGRLAGAPTDDGSVMYELPLLRLRALLAKADGHTGSYHRLVDRYRSRANALGFDAHIRYALKPQ